VVDTDQLREPLLEQRTPIHVAAYSMARGAEIVAG
jgi:hypothetical protein